MDEEQKKQEDKYKKRKTYIMIIALLILLFVILAIICILVQKQKQEMKSLGYIREGTEGITNGENEQVQNAQNTGVFTEKSPSEIIPAETVINIIRNPEYDVPTEYAFERREIIVDYLSGCNKIENLNGKVSCLDEYFLNNVAHLKPLRESCSEGDALCMDEYYLEASNYGEMAYCDIISADELKRECNGGE